MTEWLRIEPARLLNLERRRRYDWNRVNVRIWKGILFLVFLYPRVSDLWCIVLLTFTDILHKAARTFFRLSR